MNQHNNLLVDFRDFTSGHNRFWVCILVIKRQHKNDKKLVEPFYAKRF